MWAVALLLCLSVCGSSSEAKDSLDDLQEDTLDSAAEEIDDITNSASSSSKATIPEGATTSQANTLESHILIRLLPHFPITGSLISWNSRVSPQKKQSMA